MPGPINSRCGEGILKPFAEVPAWSLFRLIGDRFAVFCKLGSVGHTQPDYTGDAALCVAAADPSQQLHGVERARRLRAAREGLALVSDNVSSYTFRRGVVYAYRAPVVVELLGASAAAERFEVLSQYLYGVIRNSPGTGSLNGDNSGDINVRITETAYEYLRRFLGSDTTNLPARSLGFSQSGARSEPMPLGAELACVSGDAAADSGAPVRRVPADHSPLRDLSGVDVMRAIGRLDASTATMRTSHIDGAERVRTMIAEQTAAAGRSLQTAEVAAIVAAVTAGGSFVIGSAGHSRIGSDSVDLTEIEAVAAEVVAGRDGAAVAVG